MEPAAFAMLIFFVVGVAMAWGGYAIKYQRRYNLIAGYDAGQMQQMRDPDALGRWVGNGSLAIAAICGAGILALLIAPEAFAIIGAVMGITNGAVALVFAAGAIGRGR